MRYLACFIATGFLMLSGCYDPHAQQSVIVQQVEAAGSGNISTFTQPGLASFFSYRPALATQIAKECSSIAPTRGANWATSAEGTVCHAATLMAPPPGVIADQRTF